MQKKKYFRNVWIGLVLFLLIAVTVSSFTLDTFDDFLNTTENISLYDNANTTLKLEIHRYANVSSATVNLTGHILPAGYCVQETLNESAGCWDDDSGSYSIVEVDVGWSNPQKVYDANWSTYGQGGGSDNQYIIFNYTKPPRSVNNSIWTVKDGGAMTNLSIPQSCWSRYSDKLYFMVRSKGAGFCGGPVQCIVEAQWYCYDGTWQSLRNLQILGTSGAEIYEEKMVWNYTRDAPSNVWLEIGTPDGSYEWQYDNEFNQTLNKTADLSASITSALAKGVCSGGTLNTSTDNCSISFKFHSDTPGQITYSALNVEWLPIPFVNLTSPANNTWASTTKELVCNTTDLVQLSNVTLFVWNSTGNVYNQTTVTISGTENTTTFLVPFNLTDTFTWNCLAYNNNSLSDYSSLNNTLNVDVSNPVITLVPANDTHTAINNTLSFNCTFEGSDLNRSFLYGDFNGTWSEVDSVYPISTGQTVQFNLSGTYNESLYHWTCGANKTADATIRYSQYGNYTFVIDQTKPSVQIDSINTTVGSQTVQFGHTLSDNYNLYNCEYTIFLASLGTVDGTNNNVTFSCTTDPISATVTAYGTYNLKITAYDKAGNYRTDTKSFTTTGGSTTDSGGGGGGGDIINLSLKTIPPQGDVFVFFWPWSPDKKTRTITFKTNLEPQSCSLENSELSTSKPSLGCEVDSSSYAVSLFAEFKVDSLDGLVTSYTDELQIKATSSELKRVPIHYRVYNLKSANAWFIYIPLLFIMLSLLLSFIYWRKRKRRIKSLAKDIVNAKLIRGGY